MEKFDNPLFGSLDREEKIRYLANWIETTSVGAVLYEQAFEFATATLDEKLVVAFYLGQYVESAHNKDRVDRDEKRAEELFNQSKLDLN